MFTKYILCILTIEWAVIGTWLLKGKGKSYERIQKNDKIHEKDRFIRFQGMNLLYLALTSFLALLTTFAGSDRLTLLCLCLFGRLLYGNWKFGGKIWIRW